MATESEPFFFTPQPAPRHLAELRIETAHNAVAFSAPCAAAAGRKRRCLLPASSVRKRMRLELDPFDPAPITPPPPPTPPPTPTGTPSPVASLAGSSPAEEFSFAPGLRPRPPTAAGNMFAFDEGAPPRTPGGSDASSAAGNMFAFLAAPERPNTPTGPTSRGGFVFAASLGSPLTPTSTGSNTSGPPFLASPKLPLMPAGSKPSACEPSSLMPVAAARKGATESVGFGVIPSPEPASVQIGSPSLGTAKETAPPQAGVDTPPFVFSATRSPPPPRGSSKKRQRPNLRIETTPPRLSPRHWEEETPPQQQQLTPPPQKLAKTNSFNGGEASRSSIMSAPCCAFFSSPGKAAKQEAKKASSEASRSPDSSRSTSPARISSQEKPSKPEQEVEVSSAVCSGAEVVVHVTCKCGVHKEFSFDHRV